MRTVAALIAGFALGLGTTAFAATSANYPYLTWLGVKNVQDKIGNPYVGTPGTLSGQIAQVRTEVDGLQVQLIKLCQINHTTC